MTYSAFINAILANIESQESKRTYEVKAGDADET